MDLNKLKFWEKEVIVSESEPKNGSFLFATETNEIGILSIERIGGELKGGYTKVIFQEVTCNDKYRGGNTAHTYKITYTQHEQFVDKISKEIKAVVCNGDHI